MSSSPEGTVVWIGEQHKAVHDGDVAAKVRLTDLARRPHLYAIGPLADLAGEITVIDGAPSIATVEDEEFRTRARLEHGAAFLVWTHAAEWRAAALPAAVRTFEQLESHLPDAARAAGLPADVPLAFRIEGAAETLAYHVLSRPAGAPFTFEAHEQSKVKGVVRARDVHVIGFYSARHRGVFTPGFSAVHAHFVSGDGQLSGHVESFTLRPGATLLLPAAVSSGR